MEEKKSPVNGTRMQQRRSYLSDTAQLNNHVALALMNSMALTRAEEHRGDDGGQEKNDVGDNIEVIRGCLDEFVGTARTRIGAVRRVYTKIRIQMLFLTIKNSRTAASTCVIEGQADFVEHEILHEREADERRQKEGSHHRLDANARHHLAATQHAQLAQRYAALSSFYRRSGVAQPDHTAMFWQLYTNARAARVQGELGPFRLP